jgi:hypothetical protein
MSKSSEIFGMSGTRPVRRRVEAASFDQPENLLVGDANREVQGSSEGPAHENRSCGVDLSQAGTCKRVFRTREQPGPYGADDVRSQQVLQPHPGKNGRCTGRARGAAPVSDGWRIHRHYPARLARPALPLGGNIASTERVAPLASRAWIPAAVCSAFRERRAKTRTPSCMSLRHDTPVQGKVGSPCSSRSQEH